MIDIPPAALRVTNSEFLQHLAAGLEPGQSLWVDHFIGDPGKGHWGGIEYTPRVDVDSWARFNTYYSVAGLIPSEDKGELAVRRRMANFGRLAALVLDDFDLESPIGRVSYVLETSPGKHQVGVFLNPEDPDCADHALVRKLTSQIVVKAGLAADKSGNNMVRLVRLPVGQNQKPRESGHWDHRLDRWAPDVRHTLEDAAAVFGVDLDLVKAELVAEPVVRTGVSQASSMVDRIDELTENILNDRSLHDSFRDLAAIKIACGASKHLAIADLKVLSRRCPSVGTDRHKVRDADIERAVDTAIAKFQKLAPVLVPVAEQPKKKEPSGIPEHLLNPGGMLQVAMDWINGTASRKQPLFALTASIAMMSVALAQKVRGHTGLRTNVYFINVGLTSTGKEHPRECVIHALTAANMEDRQLNRFASAAAMYNHLATHPATLVQTDEMGMELKGARSKGSPQAGLVQGYMEVYSKTAQKAKGTVYADAKGRPAVDMEYPCLSINGSTTPSELWGALDGADIESGFLNRLDLVFASDDRPWPSYPEKTPPPEKLVKWLEATQKIVGEGAGNVEGINPAFPYVMRMPPPVLLMLEDLTAEIEGRLNAGDIDGTAGLWARTVETVWKFAMIHSCSKYEADDLIAAAADGTLEIGPDSWGWAAELVLCLKGRAVLEIRCNVGSTEFGKLKTKVVEKVLAAGVRGITLSVLIDRVRGLQGIPKKGVMDILEAAQMAGLIVKRSRDGGKNGFIDAWVDSALVEPEAGDGA